MSKSWCSEEGTELSKRNLIALHGTFTNEMLFYIDLHYKYRNYYSVFLSALFLAFITGMLQFYNQPIGKILLIIPIIIIAISEIGRRSVDRSYQSFLESIVKIAKIENLLGLDKSIKVKDEALLSPLVWERDKQFVLERYMQKRFEDKISEKFVDDLVSKGDNRFARRIFLFWDLVGFGLFISVAIYYLYPVFQ